MVRGKPYGSQQVASLLFPKKVKIIIIVMIMIIIIIIMIMMMTNITKTYPVLQNPHISPQGLLLGLVSAFPCLHLERGESMNDDDDDDDWMMMTVSISSPACLHILSLYRVIFFTGTPLKS